MKNPWTSFYWLDYLADTPHLTMLEHGAYFLLLAHYYCSGKPLDANASVLHRVCRCTTQEERDAIASVLCKFFILSGERYHHKRADEELRKCSEISSKRSISARKRWNTNAMQMDMQVQCNPHTHIKQEDYTRTREDDIEIAVTEIATLYPKIPDPKHLSHEVALAIAEAVARDGRDLVWAGTKSMAEIVAAWPISEKRFIPSAPRYFRESQYKTDPSEWERSNGNGTGTTEKLSPSAARNKRNRESLVRAAIAHHSQ